MINKNIVFFMLLQSTFLLIIITIILRLWNIDFEVPFNYRGDTLWFLSLVKGMIDNGWTYVVPQLSAPFSFNAAGFPSMTNLDWGIMKVISLFSSNPGKVLNIFWLFSLILTGWSAMTALRLIGLGSWLALWLGLVYAFLPYAFLRNTSHISLVYYCVPLLSSFAICLASGDKKLQSPSFFMVGYFAALAQGFNYIYFSFFSTLLFFFGGFYGYKRNGSRKSLKGAIIVIGILGLSSILNLLPAYFSWKEYGNPPDMDFKSLKEAEIYGLKIRRMLVPHEKNEVPFFSQWGKKDHSIPFPNENENSSSRLGPFAAFGFLFTLIVSLGLIHNNPKEMDIIEPTSAMALFSFLITTVGGFGATINQIIGPDIRCYNRFSVFIAFFSIAALGVWLQEKIRSAPSYRVQLIVLVVAMLLISFSLYDQSLDASNLRYIRQQDEQIAYSEKKFVKQLEENFSPKTAVFQLPTTVFPEIIKERMGLYEHARPYIWSSKLNWSWPSFSKSHRNWQSWIDHLEGEKLVEALIFSQFRAVWVDRFGYADEGKQIISSLVATGAKEVLLGVHPRYAVLDLQPVILQLQQRFSVDEFTKRQAQVLDISNTKVEWISGFYPVEYSRGADKYFRWSQADSEIQISNLTNKSKSIILSFLTASGRSGNLKILVGDQETAVAISGKPVSVELPLTLDPNTLQRVRFKSTMVRMPLPVGETRDLHFYIMDMYLKVRS